MTQRNDHKDDGLTAYFDAGQKIQSQPSAALFNRILTDAAVIQDTFAQPELPKPQPFWRTVLANLGGWQGMSAVAACACIGLTLGFSSADTVFSYSDLFSVTAEDDLQNLYDGTDLALLFVEG